MGNLELDEEHLHKTIQVFENGVCKETYYAITEEEKDMLEYALKQIKQKMPEAKRLITMFEGFYKKTCEK